MSSARPESNPPRRKRLWKFYPRSLRGLVTAWNTFTILMFTIAVLIGLRYGLSFMMLREEDKLLGEDTTEIGLLVDRMAPRWEIIQQALERKANSHSPRKWFCRIRSSDGTILAENSVPDIALPTPRGSNPSLQTVGSYRINHRNYLSKEVGTVQIDIGTSLEGIDDDVVRLTQLILIAGAILLLLAPIGGFWLAGRVIRPLGNIIETTARLRPLNLDERLPVRDTDDELDRLSTTINGFLDRIAIYLAHNRELTANVAHELRSPLTAIMCSVEVALNRDRTIEEYKDLLVSIVDEGSRLGSLVQQLLLLAESDAGRLTRADEPVRLDSLVRKAVEMFQGIAETRGVGLEAHAPSEVWVCGDAGQLRQVIFNTIDNAIKFTSDGFVHVEVRTDSEKRALLVVTDTGIGIPAEYLPHVFDRFNRGDRSRARLAAGGSGLGLSICQALVAAHGGTIAIKSQVGRGTEVRIVLPALPTHS